MKKKISIYLRNKEINPSGYYRIYQYFHEMNIQNIRYRELVPDFIYKRYHFQNNWFNKLMYSAVILLKSFSDLVKDILFYRPDIVIINREICPKIQSTIHYLLERKVLRNAYVIWDFDDAIQISGEISKREWDLLENESDKIVVLNNYLKKSISPQNCSKVDFLPTTDGDYVRKEFEHTNIRKENYNKEIRMLWLATATNIPYLKKCLPYLEKAAQILEEKFSKKLILTCVCNKEVKADVKYLVIKNIKWDRQKALELMRNSHIGIMPLEDDNFTRGKGGFKLIQYMSAAMPVIASDVGFNKEVVKQDFGFLVKEKEEWCSSIIKLSTNYEFWSACSQSAQKEWNLNYSYQKIYDYWVEAVR